MALKCLVLAVRSVIYSVEFEGGDAIDVHEDDLEPA